MPKKAMITLTLNDAQIVETIRKHRWPKGVKCPYCNSNQIYKYGKAPYKPCIQRYLCRNCGKQFNDLTGTPLAERRIPLNKALAIAYLYFKLGLSQSAIARELGVSRLTVIRTLRIFGNKLKDWFRILEA